MSRGAPFHRPPTAQEAVLGELRRMLVDGDLPPGAKIAQDAIAGQLGVSRHPVREALKTLEGEGQITYEPQRGYFVTELDPDDLVELYTLRELLENEATRVATPRLTEADLDRIAEAYDGVDKAMKTGDIPTLIHANRSFHFALLTPCDMPRLLRLVNQLWDASSAYRARHFAEPANRDTSHAEHAQMLAAARAMDTDELIRLSNQHRAHAVPTLVRTLGRDQ